MAAALSGVPRSNPPQAWGVYESSCGRVDSARNLLQQAIGGLPACHDYSPTMLLLPPSWVQHRCRRRCQVLAAPLASQPWSTRPQSVMASTRRR